MKNSYPNNRCNCCHNLWADFPFFWHLVETTHQSTILYPVPTFASEKSKSFIILIQCKSLKKHSWLTKKILNFFCRYNFKRMNKFSERTDAFEQSEHIPQGMAHTEFCELRAKLKQRAFGKHTTLRILFK